MESTEHAHQDETMQLKREIGNLKASLLEKERALQELDLELQDQDHALKDLNERNDRKRCVPWGAL